MFFDIDRTGTRLPPNDAAHRAESFGGTLDLQKSKSRFFGAITSGAAPRRRRRRGAASQPRRAEFFFGGVFPLRKSQKNDQKFGPGDRGADPHSDPQRPADAFCKTQTRRTIKHTTPEKFTHQGPPPKTLERHVPTKDPTKDQTPDRGAPAESDGKRQPQPQAPFSEIQSAFLWKNGMLFWGNMERFFEEMRNDFLRKYGMLFCRNMK